MIPDSMPEVGYCTNVHPGNTMEQVQQQLARYSTSVRSLLELDQPLGIGLWLSATAVDELNDGSRLAQFRDWLEEHQLLPYTFNGFPFGDFHKESVRHDVYLPTWADSTRLNFTKRLAEIQHALLPGEMLGSISTLPLAWPSSPEHDEQIKTASARHLRKLAEFLHQLFESHGREICVCLEPEPGCLFDSAADVTRFFDQNLLTGDSEVDARIRRHIGVCHDICHSAVMFEGQRDALEAYRDNGVRVGKVQVSSAIELDFEDREKQAAMMKALHLLTTERKYLHQTVVQQEQRTEFHEDLSDAIKHYGEPATGRWRVHFHVPIFLKEIGVVRTTQDQIDEVIDFFASDDSTGVPHFEVETYSWNVFPDCWEMPELADGITQEVRWFIDRMNRATE